MIQNLFFFSFFFFENIISGTQLLYIRPRVPVDISFTQKTSFILRTSTHLTLKMICSRNTGKNLSDIRNFPANMFLFGVRKNICTAPFLDAQQLHSWSTLKTDIRIFLSVSIKKCLLQRRSKILSDGEWVDGGGGRAWIISLKQLGVWAS